MAIHPVGPLPASTYWLRRGALLVGVVVLLLVARSCAGGDGGGTETTSTPSAKPRSTPSTSASPTTSSGACADADLSVTADTQETIYPVGGRPQLTVTVKNTSSSSCTRDVGAGAVELLVFSGNDRVWSSDDCEPSTKRDVVTLPAKGEKTIAVTWSGKRSKPSCAGTRDQVKAGTYRLTARVGTLRSDGATFRFRS